GGIMAVAAFATGSLFAPPVQQAIAAVIATDVQCTGCVGTSDVAGNAITAAKLKDGEVKAAEIATDAVGADEIAKDAVGASEIKGVDKLIFADCAIPAVPGPFPSGYRHGFLCPLAGIDPEDDVIVTDNTPDCFSVIA